MITDFERELNEDVENGMLSDNEAERLYESMQEELYLFSCRKEWTEIEQREAE